MSRTFVLLATLAAILTGAGRAEAELKLKRLPDVWLAGPVWADPLWSLNDAGEANLGSSALGTYPLLTGGDATFVSDSRAFLVDDLLYSSRDSVMDEWGLLYRAGPTEIHMESNSPGDDSLSVDSSGSANSGAGKGPPAIRFTPEPNTLAIAALAGLGLLGYARHRRHAA